MGTHKNKSYPLRVDEKLMVKMAYIAETNKRTRNKEIEYLLEEHVKEFESEHGEIKIDGE